MQKSHGPSRRWYVRFHFHVCIWARVRVAQHAVRLYQRFGYLLLVLFARLCTPCPPLLVRPPEGAYCRGITETKGQLLCGDVIGGELGSQEEERGNVKR